ncbi:MAG: hypothetical protein JHC95_15230 [Solirubrobacteraceae bacterium]|nr:hypothetical protein [Solirubrobacteraceae bacterium]
MAGTRITFVGGESLVVDEEPKRVASYVKTDRTTEFTRDGKPIYVLGANVLYIEAELGA